jgi:hypothetical protein
MRDLSPSPHRIVAKFILKAAATSTTRIIRSVPMSAHRTKMRNARLADCAHVLLEIGETRVLSTRIQTPPDGLRSLAVLPVILFHVGNQCGEFEIPVISQRVLLGISNSKTALGHVPTRLKRCEEASQKRVYARLRRAMAAVSKDGRERVARHRSRVYPRSALLRARVGYSRRASSFET